MRNFAISKVYASALLELARDAGEVDAVAADLDSFCELLAASSELRQVFLSPELGYPEKRAVLERVMADATELARRFVLVLVRRHREAALEGIVEVLGRLRDEDAGRIRGRLASARAMDAAEFAGLQKAIGEAVGKDVVLEAETDATLLAGRVLTFEDRTLDGSLRTRLSRMKNRLLTAELGKE